MMPMTEAAGPDRMDWTGNDRDTESGMVPPSALSTLMLAPAMPSSAAERSTASQKRL